MNNHLLREWRSRVRAGKTIICLGDVAHPGCVARPALGPRPPSLSRRVLHRARQPRPGPRGAAAGGVDRDQAEVIAKAIHDGLEHGDHVTSDQFRTRLADALMKFCRGLFATTNLIYLSRQIPLLRERLIVLLSGGYDRVDMEALVAASVVRPEGAG